MSNEKLYVLKCGLLNDTNQVERYDFITWSAISGTSLTSEIINYYGVRPEYSTWHALRSFEIFVKDENNELVVIDHDKNIHPTLNLLKQQEDKPMTIWIRCPFLKQKPKRLLHLPKTSSTSFSSRDFPVKNWHTLCSYCKSEIQGFIYRCLECTMYNLCSECNASGIHPEHALIRMAGQMKTQNIMVLVNKIMKEFIAEDEAGSSSVAHDSENYVVLRKVEAGIDKLNSLVKELEKIITIPQTTEDTILKLQDSLSKRLDAVLKPFIDPKNKGILESLRNNTALENANKESVQHGDQRESQHNHLAFEEINSIAELDLEPKDSSCSSTRFQCIQNTIARDEDAYWTLVENEVAEAEASELCLTKLPIIT